MNEGYSWISTHFNWLDRVCASEVILITGAFIFWVTGIQYPGSQAPFQKWCFIEDDKSRLQKMVKTRKPTYKFRIGGLAGLPGNTKKNTPFCREKSIYQKRHDIWATATFNPGMTWTMIILVGWWQDPYFMADIIIPKYNWVGFHPLYQTTNQGFVMASYWYLHMGVEPKIRVPQNGWWKDLIWYNPNNTTG